MPTLEQLARWLDVLSFLDDDVRDACERMGKPNYYTEYDKMIDEIYTLLKEQEGTTRLYSKEQ